MREFQGTLPPQAGYRGIVHLKGDPDPFHMPKAFDFALLAFQIPMIGNAIQHLMADLRRFLEEVIRKGAPLPFPANMLGPSCSLGTV
jgi:predicted component of type VI protein secretion system